jgi:hypothetical protein
MTEKDALRFVLRAAVEYPLGLFQVLWGLRSSFPEASDSERDLVGRAAVRDLLDRGWIALYLEPWQPGSGAPDVQTAIPPDDWSDVVSVPENWDAPRFNSYVTIAATGEGKAAYRHGALDD